MTITIAVTVRMTINHYHLISLKTNNDVTIKNNKIIAIIIFFQTVFNEILATT
jgi:hypothetical protein